MTQPGTPGPAWESALGTEDPEANPFWPRTSSVVRFDSGPQRSSEHDQAVTELEMVSDVGGACYSGEESGEGDLGSDKDFEAENLAFLS